MHEPGLPELVSKNAERLTFTTDMGEVLDSTRLLFCCVDTPPTYSGDADLSRVEAVVDELGDSDEHAIVMKSTVPVGTGRSIQRRREGLGYVSNPEFLKEGSAVEDFMHPDRVVVGRRRALGGVRRPRGRAVRAARRPDRAHRRGQRRDDQAGLERLPGHQDLVHQRDRQRVRGARRGRERGGARDGPRRPHRAEVPAGGPRLRRQLLPQGRERAQAARRQLRLRLPAAHLRDRGQRAPEAARRRQAAEAPRLARGQGDRAARRGVQARHRRHPRGHQPRAGRPAAGRGRERARVRPGRRRRRRASMLGGARDLRLGRSRRSTAPTPRCS